jgi:hypothetical protein
MVNRGDDEGACVVCGREAWSWYGTTGYCRQHWRDRIGVDTGGADAGYDQGYDQGYADGLQAGIAAASDAWRRGRARQDAG